MSALRLASPLAPLVPLSRSTQLAEHKNISSCRNCCIAGTIKRFPIDLYHINDFQGAAAPLHLLPGVIPCCLSIHDSDFQGQWSERTLQGNEEPCRISNLNPGMFSRYIKYGGVSNLPHVGVSYLREWQGEFGAVRASTKYSTGSSAGNPTFWGLGTTGSPAYPDHGDAEIQSSNIAGPPTANSTLVGDFRAKRALLRTQVQEWAQLEKNPNADLFLFVGCWSKQKGIDLIADLFPAILEKYSTAQLICVGPVVDLYGKFAALKFENMSRLYPRRVCFRPDLTAAPSYIYEGAEFVLIPSRDEPSSLVVMESGRNGALGVGARVGGSEHMPGWWFTPECTSSKHMIRQFKKVLEAALASNANVRAGMRAQSLKQQYPVSQWRIDLCVLHDNAVRLSQRNSSNRACGMASLNRLRSGSVDAFRSKMSRSAKDRHGGPTGPLKPTSPVKPLSRVANLTGLRERDCSYLNPGLWMDPDHVIGDPGRPKNNCGNCFYQGGRNGATPRYVLGHISPSHHNHSYKIQYFR